MVLAVFLYRFCPINGKVYIYRNEAITVNRYFTPHMNNIFKILLFGLLVAAFFMGYANEDSKPVYGDQKACK